MTRPGPRRVVLVGFMGSGKSTVGRLLADALGWSFVDVDERIEAEAGRPIARIFAEDGEAAFREMESRLAAAALEGDDTVVATGGGWAAARPGRLRGLPDGTLTVWLHVTGDEAVRRVAEDPRRRPLLEVADPAGRARALLASRGPAYAEATLRVDTDALSAEDVCRRILEHFGPPGPTRKVENR